MGVRKHLSAHKVGELNAHFRLPRKKKPLEALPVLQRPAVSKGKASNLGTSLHDKGWLTP